jgi:hypothetical protein
VKSAVEIYAIKMLIDSLIIAKIDSNHDESSFSLECVLSIFVFVFLVGEMCGLVDEYVGAIIAQCFVLPKMRLEPDHSDASKDIYARLSGIV